MKKIGTSVSVIMLLAICLFGLLQMGFSAKLINYFPNPIYICCDDKCTPQGCWGENDVWYDWGPTLENKGYEWGLHAMKWDWFGDLKGTQYYAQCRDGWTNSGQYAERYNCEHCDDDDPYDMNSLNDVGCRWGTARESCGWWRQNKATPATPTGVSKSGDVTISWSSAQYADKYRLKRSTNGGVTWSTVADPPSTYYYDDVSQISYETTIAYQVFAINLDESHNDDEILSAGSDIVYYGPHTTVTPSQSAPFDDNSITETQSSCFVVGNSGDGSLNWTTSYFDDWLTYVTPSGEDGDPIGVTIDRSQLSSSDLLNHAIYQGQISINSSEGGNVQVTVNMELCAPIGAASLQITNSTSWGQSPHLSWTSVPLAAEYEVKRKVDTGSWILIATTSSTSYTDNDFVLGKNASTVYYQVFATNAGGSSSGSNIPSVLAELAMETNQDQSDLTLDFGESMPDQYALLNCYPNPGNPGTTITFQLPEAGSVDLYVANINGRIINRLANGRYPVGIHRVSWNGRDQNDQPISTGIYFYILRAGGKVFSKKFSLVK
ncbi:T9SS type A sorting domain-containing protein [bacterium]|nr:T9SS type A sorting domain-containing protein [bacterium]